MYLFREHLLSFFLVNSYDYVKYQPFFQFFVCLFFVVFVYFYLFLGGWVPLLMVCFEFNSVEIAVSNLSDIEVNRGKPCQILTLIVAIDCQKQLINFQSLLSYQIVVIITKHNIVMINFVQEQRHAELRLVATQVKLSGECIRLIYT